jgi:hypothetical protein
MHILEDNILLYLENKLREESRQELEAHIGRCSECAERFVALSRIPQSLSRDLPFELDNETRRKAEGIVPAEDSERRFRFFESPYRIAFASFSIAVIAFLTFVLIPREEPSQFRSNEDAKPLLQLFPSDGETITEAPLTFRWTATEKSSAYKFSLMDDAGVVLWSWDVSDTSITLPSTVVLHAGKTYLWRVESFLADKSLERSTLHAFGYRPSK